LSKADSEAIEFASPEELIRFDAAQTPLPDQLAAKLEKTLEEEPKPQAKGFFKKLFRSE
jgi:hypothetical protein